MVVKSTVKVVKLKVVKVNVRLVPILAIQCHDYETITYGIFFAISYAALLAGY